MALIGLPPRFRAAQRVLNAFSYMMAPFPRRSFWGLAHWRSRAPSSFPCLSVPFGWAVWREPWRAREHVMPVWLYVLVRLWESRWAPAHVALCLELLHLEEGGYYRDARPRWPAWLRRAVWCFLNDEDHAPVEAPPPVGRVTHIDAVRGVITVTY